MGLLIHVLAAFSEAVGFPDRGRDARSGGGRGGGQADWVKRTRLGVKAMFKQVGLYRSKAVVSRIGMNWQRKRQHPVVCFQIFGL